MKVSIQDSSALCCKGKIKNTLLHNNIDKFIRNRLSLRPKRREFNTEEQKIE